MGDLGFQRRWGWLEDKGEWGKRNILLLFVRDISTTHVAHSRELDSIEENLVELVPIDPRQLVLAPHRETGSSSDADISGEGLPEWPYPWQLLGEVFRFDICSPFLLVALYIRLDAYELCMMSLTVVLI